MNAELPLATTWFHSTQITDTITRIEEPHVHEMVRANIWHIRGSDRDLIVDAGLGVASLRDHLPELFLNNPILIITHAHLDHVGSAHEFADLRMHPGESGKHPIPASLNGPTLAALLGIDWPDAPEMLLDARPDSGFAPEQYSLPALRGATALHDGDLIDLGSRTLRVLHLPGHTPGSISLFDDLDGSLFSGDVIYEGPLLDELHESNVDDYVESLLRLKLLPVTRVFPGHNDSFGVERMHEIIEHYIKIQAPLSKTLAAGIERGPDAFPSTASAEVLVSRVDY